MADLSVSELHLEVLASGPQKRINEVRRFAILTLGSIGMICSSFGYAFSLVMPSMQARYEFTQRQTATVTTVGLVFGYCMLPFAFLFDHFGPTPVATLSVVMYPLGCILTALCFQGVIAGSTARLSVFNAIQSVGLSMSDLVCCMTVLAYFPSNRGPVIALLKTCMGIGSAIVGSLYTGFFSPNIAHYLYFLACLSFIVNLLSTVVMRMPTYHMTGYEETHVCTEERQRRTTRKAQYLKQQPPMARFIYGFIVLIILIVYLPTSSAIIAYHSLGKQTKLAIGIVTVVLACCLLLIAMPLPRALTLRVPWCHRGHLEGNGSEGDEKEDDDISADLSEVQQEHRMLAHHMSSPTTSNTSENEPYQPEKPHAATVAVGTQVGLMERHADSSNMDTEDHPTHGHRRHTVVETDVDFLAPQYQGTFLQNLKTLELWALWWTLFCVIGTEFVVIYNASFILGALQGSKPSSALTTLLTVLNGVGSAAGRLLMSAFEVWSQKRKAEDRIPITVALFFPTTSIIITLILFLTLPAAALPLPYVVAAFGNGFCAASQILVTRTIFAKDPAKHYHFCFSSTMVATIALNRFLYGEWYTAQADKQHLASKLCYGKRCVLMPLCVLLGLTCSAFVTDVALHLRYRAYSRKVLAERARLRGEVGSASQTVMELDDGLGSGEATATLEPAMSDSDAARRVA